MNKLFARILNSSCFFYTIISFIINFIPWLFSKDSQNTMLKIWANFIILLVCFVFCSVFEYKGRKKEKITRNKLKLVFLSCVIYTISSFLLNIIQYIIKKENFWNGYTLLILILFSMVCSILILKVKIKNYFLASLFNYLIIGIFYYIFFVVKAGFTRGNHLLISLGIYTLIFLSSTIIYYLSTAKKKKKQNSEKTYKNLFS